ncbi:hypothetical protein, partial [Mycolicibacterium hassiacum]|uniref:hypothetical protein n=1 Tax=Mycolicibacterium hassiacum TaxID=46351 RepID=UPI0023F87967
MATPIGKHNSKGAGRHRRRRRPGRPQAVYPSFTLSAAEGAPRLSWSATDGPASYVGRVGTLAVALGVGVMVTMSQGA